MSILDSCWAKYINLDHRTDRKDHMEKELKRVGIKAKRFKAFKTSEHPWTEWKVGTMLRRTPGAIGCWYSQCNLLAEAYQLDKHCFVMEDDLVFCDDFHERLNYLEKFLEEKSFDILWFGGTVHLNPAWWHKEGHQQEIRCTCNLKRDAETTEDPRIIRTYGAFSTHAYFVHKDSILKVLTMLDSIIGHSIGIDAAFIELAPQLTCYMMLPGMIKQFDNRSDIGSGITYYSGFEKLGPYFWKNKMEEFDPIGFNFGEAEL